LAKAQVVAVVVVVVQVVQQAVILHLSMATLQEDLMAAAAVMVQTRPVTVVPVLFVLYGQVLLAHSHQLVLAHRNLLIQKIIPPINDGINIL
jgi:hypothetical protein